MNTVAQGAGGVAYEAVGDVARFPLWWYTTGVVYVLSRAVASAKQYARVLAIAVWVKNIFVPMYGQHDVQGRIISVFFRVVQIVGRGIALCVYVVMLAVLVAAYVALPLIAAAFFVYHIFGGFFAYGW